MPVRTPCRSNCRRWDCIHHRGPRHAGGDLFVDPCDGAAAGVADRAAPHRRARSATGGGRARRCSIVEEGPVIVGRQPGTLGSDRRWPRLVSERPRDDRRRHQRAGRSAPPSIRASRWKPSSGSTPTSSSVGDMGETEEEHRRRQPTTERLWRMQPHVRAAQTGAVHAVTSDAFVVRGPRVVEQRRRSSAGLRLRARSSLLSVLSLRNAGWRAGATPIVERVTLDAGAGEFIALMGRNGAGKVRCSTSWRVSASPQRGASRSTAVRCRSGRRGTARA